MTIERLKFEIKINDLEEFTLGYEGDTNDIPNMFYIGYGRFVNTYRSNGAKTTRYQLIKNSTAEGICLEWDENLAELNEDISFTKL